MFKPVFPFTFVRGIMIEFCEMNLFLSDVGYCKILWFTLRPLH